MIFENDQKHSIIKEICVFAILSLAVNICAVCCGVNAAACLIFSAYQITGIFLPGMAACVLLFKGKNRAISFFCLSYMLGYAINVLDYFVIAAIGLSSNFARVVFLVNLFVALPIVIHNRKNKWLDSIGRNDIPFLALLLTLLAVSFFSYSARFSLPGHTADTVQYHADSLYWIENAAAMKIAFPPAELRMSDTVLYYHYFPSAFLAFVGL